jgi:hypothetical protein
MLEESLLLVLDLQEPDIVLMPPRSLRELEWPELWPREESLLLDLERLDLLFCFCSLMLLSFRKLDLEVPAAFGRALP